MKTLAIITARGGSKRIPKKNIKAFHGKPIIAYSILAALESTLFDEVMVSTDDKEISAVAKEYGAVIPFFRSPKNSDDFATTSDVLAEVLEQYHLSGKTFDYACCIYPTAPFIKSEKLRKAFQTLIDKKADVVIPVAKYSSSIWRSLKMNEQKKISYIWPEYAQKRSQDLEESYYDCGQFYFFCVPEFLESKQLITKNTIGLETPATEVQDIDNEEDWKMAELKFRLLTNN